MKIDMHVHSRYSHDGCMSPEDLIAAARRAGLNGAAVCDHNTLAGSKAAQAVCPDDFLIIPGAEYSTDVGHVLAYFIDEGAEDADLPRLADGRFVFEELARFVRARDGLLVLAHPLRHRSDLPEELLRAFDGLEVFNARQMARYPRTTAPMLRAADRPVDGRARMRLLTAGSDAHRPCEVGGAYVELHAETAEGVRAALLSGRYICRGRPARRRHEAIGRMGGHGVSGLPRDLARLAVFTLRDVWDTRPGGREWREWNR